MKILECQMIEGCKETVTHIDSSGFIYCLKHGRERKTGHGRNCRKLKPTEIKKLTQGQQLERY